jgi:putative transposase
MKNGITIFMSRTCNSYAKYFNTKYKRNGPLFQGNFKAVRITSNEQLIHVSRYIHLNPLVDYLTKNLKDYPFSSFPEYLGLEKGISSPKIVLDQFKTGKDYQDFVQDQKDYAQRLKEIKRFALEG